ncbi:MAG: sugar ABC transporter substrate-binding protein [Syntrophales bacterium]
MRKRLTVFTLGLTLFLSAAVVFANGQSEGGKAEGGKSGQPTIALLILGMESRYPPVYVAKFSEVVKNAGMNFFLFNAKFDAQLQAQQMDDAIAMKPAMIVIFALDSQGLAPAIKKAYEAGIPVFMCNNPPVKESEQYTVAYAGPNNYLEGQLVGEIIHEKLGGKGAKIVMIEGVAGQDAQIKRAQGAMDKLRDLGSDVKLIARQCADWRTDKAVQVMQDFITRYGKEISGVYGQDDNLALGAVIALQESGADPSGIPIIGINGCKEALQAVNEGKMYCTILQSPIKEAALEANMAVEMVKKGFTRDSKWNPYWNFMETPKVFKSNVSQYLPGDW